MVKGMNDIIEAWERVECEDERRKKAAKKVFWETIGMCAFVTLFMGYVLFELFRKGNM